MPIVVQYNDPRIVASLAGSAGIYATNRQDNADALQQQQFDLQRQRYSDAQMSDLLALNQRNREYQDQLDLQQQRMDLERQQFGANEQQRQFANNLASNQQDYQQNIAPQQELARQQAITQATQQAIASRQQADDARSAEQKQAAQEAALQRNLAGLEEMKKQGLDAALYGKMGAAIRSGANLLDAYRTYTGQELDQQRENRMEQPKPEKESAEYTQAVRVARDLEAQRTALLNRYKDPVLGEYKGDKAELQRLDQMVNKAWEHANSLRNQGAAPQQPMAGRAPATQPAPPANAVPDQLAQSALYVAQKNGKDPRQIAQTLVQLHGLGRPSPQQVLQAAGGDLMLAADLADALGL